MVKSVSEKIKSASSNPIFLSQYNIYKEYLLKSFKVKTYEAVLTLSQLISITKENYFQSKRSLQFLQLRLTAPAVRNVKKFPTRITGGI